MRWPRGRVTVARRQPGGGVHAQASPDWPALSSRSRRVARPGGTGGCRLSPESGLGPGWLARRRRFLHPERLPHHRPVADPVRTHRAAATGRFLAAPGPAAAAGPVRDAGRGRRLGHAAGHAAAAGYPRRGRCLGGVCEQLVADRPAQLLLRQVRPAVTARSPVVPGRGRAVLPDLALAAVARAALVWA